MVAQEVLEVLRQHQELVLGELLQVVRIGGVGGRAIVLAVTPGICCVSCSTFCSVLESTNSLLAVRYLGVHLLYDVSDPDSPGGGSVGGGGFCVSTVFACFEPAAEEDDDC